MKNKKESKLVRVVLLVNLVLAVILMSSMSYAYFVSKDIIADNKIEIGTIDVKGVVSNLQVPAAFTVDGGKADITTNGSILINNATPNTTFTFDLTLTNISSLNNCYNIIFNSTAPSVVDSFSVSAVREGGTAADNLSFASLSGRKESKLVAWDASATDTTRKYNFTLTIGDNPVSGKFNIDIISTQKSAGNFVSNRAELSDTPSGGLAVFANDMGTAVAPVDAIALTKPLDIDLNGHTLYTKGFSLDVANAKRLYTIKNSKIVTTVDGVNIVMTVGTLNIADSVFQVPADKAITIKSSPIINISGATAFQRKSSEGYVDVAADIVVSTGTEVVIARSVPRAIGLNVVNGSVDIINESTAPSTITIAEHTVSGRVRIENSGALASITDNARSADAVVQIINDTNATISSIVVESYVTAKVEIWNNGTINTLTANNTAALSVIKSNGATITTKDGTNSNITEKVGVSTSAELQAALASSQPIIYVTKDINDYTAYTVNHNVKIIGMETPSSGKVRHISGTITCPPDTIDAKGKIVAALTEEYVAFRDIQQKDIDTNLTTAVDVFQIAGYPIRTKVFNNGKQLTKEQLAKYDIDMYCSNFAEVQDGQPKTLTFKDKNATYVEEAQLFDTNATGINYTITADGSILVACKTQSSVGRYYLVLKEKGTETVRLVTANLLIYGAYPEKRPKDINSDNHEFESMISL